MTLARIALALLLAVPVSLVAQDSTKPAHPASKNRPASPPKPAKVKPLELNTASRAELLKLPGVDGTMADRIIAGRPYRTKTNLVTRKLMPPVLYATLRHLVSARKSPAAK